MWEKGKRKPLKRHPFIADKAKTHNKLYAHRKEIRKKRRREKITKKK
jgi:hypothetical protein